MDFKHLQYFIAIVEAGSLSKAAKKVFIAQTSLSEHLKALEIKCGIRLLERHSQGMRPTPAGKIFYAHANAILRMQAAMIASVQGAEQTIKGSVSVGMPNSVSEILAVPLLRQAHLHFPNVRLSLQPGLSGTLEKSMRNGKLDIALLFIKNEESIANDLHILPMLTEEMFVAISKSIFGYNGKINLSDLQDVLFFCPGREHGLTKLIEQYACIHDISLNFGSEVNSLSAMVGTAAAGLGYTLLSGSAFNAARAYPDLLLLPLSPPLKRPLSLCQTKIGYLYPAVQAIKDLILRITQDLVNQGEWKGACLALSSLS